MSFKSGDNLKHAMRVLGLNQKDLAALWDITQPSVSDKINGRANISLQQASKFESEYGINKYWLLDNEGSMRVASKVSEGEVEYHANAVLDTSESACTARFVAAIDEYERTTGENKQDIAAKLLISKSHLSQLRNPENRKFVTASMLANGVINLGLDANQILALQETNECEALKREVERLKEDNENMRLLISSLKRMIPAENKERA